MVAGSARELSSSVSDAIDVTHRGVTTRDLRTRRTRFIRLVHVVAPLLVASSCATRTVRETDIAIVKRVVDGDTVVLSFSGDDDTVRLIGIDTPETVKPNSPVECFGPEAAERTKFLLPPETKVRVERDIEARDRYGRLLAYLRRVDDGLFINESLITEGFATPLRIEPNVAYSDSFARAAEDARARRLGLWAVCQD